MTTDIDYCDTGYQYCTQPFSTAGAKYEKCPESTACGSQSIYYLVDGEVKVEDIYISLPGICIFTIYYVLEDPDTNFDAKDWPQDQSKAQEASTTGSYYIAQNLTDYQDLNRYFTINDKGEFDNLTTDTTYYVPYGEPYYLYVATSFETPDVVMFSLKLGTQG
mmetsp:Transcript_14558/g.14183  ORF Transcript_14558/g.14183 Transcript_14558/m.14183 type:complete len:163 (-) Transcript_14558:115-603(-)|eukprot:CAMPEP_0170543458 /NCGR_PEP_ID=MMETSP0211-20121228/2567_1 /TAXON_ID=311385 /ORGANISM="Pseudokeronopsis sp., Strain OXSARD2" /LENGTH=162 /DNA_ID=CAMNT_0010846835 /DNA_START=157 /DNA_END=645 /DNA_ORIENTATION=-